MRRFAVIIAALAIGLLSSLAASAESGDTLRLVRARGFVRCGVSDGTAGMSERDAAGRWSGMDVDFCRAVAAAVLADASKVRFQPLGLTSRFPAMASREIDLLARDTTWTVVREATFSLLFVGVTYFDSQGFLAPRDTPAGHGHHWTARASASRMAATSATIALYADEHGCAYPGDGARSRRRHRRIEAWRLRGLCADLPSSPRRCASCPTAMSSARERIAQEPLGPAVRWDDGQWVAMVRGVYAALIDAEARGLTQDDARKLIKGQPDPAHLTYLDETGGVGRAFGISPLWAALAVASVGNYGEVLHAISVPTRR